MKQSSKYFILTSFVLFTCQFVQVNAQSTEYNKVYDNCTPNEFLDNLRKYTKFTFVTYGTAPVEWIKKSDIDILITRVCDTTAVPSVVNTLSSFLPDKKSCIGREAQNMIEAYINKKGYLDFLYSYGSVDTLNAIKLIYWYKKK